MNQVSRGADDMTGGTGDTPSSRAGASLEGVTWCDLEEGARFPHQRLVRRDSGWVVGEGVRGERIGIEQHLHHTGSWSVGGGHPTRRGKASNCDRSSFSSPPFSSPADASLPSVAPASPAAFLPASASLPASFSVAASFSAFFLAWCSLASSYRLCCTNAFTSSGRSTFV